MKDFLGFNLPPGLLNSLEEMKFQTPTPIQAKVIPEALNGRDILGSAQTGTGKTAAFGIPLAVKLIQFPKDTALVLTPTRELALQVIKMLEALLKHSNIKAALLIGGESIFKQLKQLKRKPRLIVGTPGRINDHLLRGSLNLQKSNFLVLDETDRMLDMGFIPQIDKIIEYLPPVRQTLLFSATLPKNIISIANKYLTKPSRISVDNSQELIKNLDQEVIYVTEQDKFSHLKTQLEERKGSIIVFVKTKLGAERVVKKLREEMHKADTIHGDLTHNKRKHAIIAFRESKYRILVATDIAARGLDIPHVKHVINYDLPQCPEDYVHRIGRTARAGAKGSALCFIAPADKKRWSLIRPLLKIEGSLSAIKETHPVNLIRMEKRKEFRKGNILRNKKRPMFLAKKRFKIEKKFIPAVAN